MGTRILFVGNDRSVQNQLDQLAAGYQWQPESAASAEEAIEMLSEQSFDALVATVELPGMSGLELLAQCQRRRRNPITVIITKAGTIETAVNAMKLGATDVFTGSVSLASIREAIEDNTRRALGWGPGGEAGGGVADEFVARSGKLRQLLDQVAAIAPYNATVLITGESGTGKELVARAVHEQSQRRRRTFVALNCAAIPDQLLEDELFGHVKGAFTGAVNSREGRFELANGGTLFLDEIGDMSLSLQAKLLRVLQEREFEKLGSSRTIKVDVRIIAATSSDLEQKIKDGTFRLDLFYRLNVMHLRLPPLRERPEDVLPLAEQLLARFCASVGLPQKRLDEQVLKALASYHWPGNVRQLQNAMERAAALSGAATTIDLPDLPEEILECAVFSDSPGTPSDFPMDAALLPRQSLPPEGVSLDAVVTNIERELLLRSLSQTGGNKMQAARLLRMKRTTFVEKLKRLQIEELSDEMITGMASKADGYSL
ncbi:MAG: sigma-54-dependent transcriptional regulator [Blastocatellia bacterium]